MSAGWRRRVTTGSRRSRPGRFPPGAVVTGAGSGLGRAIAGELHAAGWCVLATDVDGAAAVRAADALGLVGSATLDVTDAAACVRVADDADERLGGLGLWVNNAGVLATGPLWEAEETVRHLVVDVNVHGVLNGTRAALAPMRSRGRGHVVTVVSLAGLLSPPGEVLYAATKHAALAVSLGVATDLRLAGHRHIHASAICPDGMWTPMLAECSDDPAAAVSWSGGLLDPTHVAKVVAGVAARPRPVRSIPRQRGATARLASAFPSAASPFVSGLVRRGRRRQLAWARRTTTHRATTDEA